MDFNRGVFNSIKLNTALLITVGCLSAAIAFGSRAFVIGYSVALLFIFSKSKKSIFDKLKKKLLLGLFLGITLLTFFIKTDSSLGRLLVYKISLQIAKDNFVNGVGIGCFDNTNYAFNDYLQFVIETGLAGVVVLAIVCFFVVAAIRKAFIKSPSKIILGVATCQLISVLIAATFTHIFERPFFQCIALVGLGIVIIETSNYKFKSPVKIIYITVIFATVYWCHLGHCVIRYNEYKKFKNAQQLAGTGYVNEALKIYQSMRPSLGQDISFLRSYANLLVIAGQYENALKEFESLQKIENRNIDFQSLGDCYYKLGNLKLAEDAYTNAVYRVPNRFTTRYALFNFYIETKQNTKARVTGNSILELPVKIPSKQVDTIKGLVRQWLAAFKK